MTLNIRPATSDDLAEIIALFAADLLGGHGDTTDPEAFADYQAAFDRIAASPATTLYVADRNGEIVGTIQTTVLTTLSGRGSSSLLIEGVQTRSDLRGQGIGAAMMRFAIQSARQQGLARVQLTSSALRTDAHRFYRRLGFADSHLGFKMSLK